MTKTRDASKFAQRRKNFKALGKLAPKLKIAIGPQFSADPDYAVVLPFKRSPVAISISGIFFVVFAIPLIGILGGASAGMDDSLFSLVALLFGLFWGLGWSVAVVILGLLFLVLSFGRETLQVKGSELTLRLGIPLLGLGATYRGELIRNFRSSTPDASAGTSWRGEHLAFDYAGESLEFGSDISGERAQEIMRALKSQFPRQGDGAPELPTVSAGATVVEDLPATHVSAVEVGQQPIVWSSVSSLALIAANLIPLAGVVFLQWSIGEIMLLFWAESAVIGFYNLLKMGKIAGLAILFYGPFFVGHYGGFMVGHLLFIYGFFGDNFASGADVSVGQLGEDFLRLLPALFAFFVSHGISYVVNFLQREEFQNREVSEQMGLPYRRIIIMHMTIIFGGFLAMLFETALPALLLLIALKIVADLRGHLKEHTVGVSA